MSEHSAEKDAAFAIGEGMSEAQLRAQRIADRSLARMAMSMQYDEANWFPFVEDENANITGFGHQDRAKFAGDVNRYDEICMGEPYPEHERWTAEAITHDWVVISDDGEFFRKCGRSHVRALPVTCLWGQR